MSLLSQWTDKKLDLTKALIYSTSILEHKKAYIELKYIESTGTQYINTRTKTTNNSKIEIKYRPSSNRTIWRKFLVW